MKKKQKEVNEARVAELVRSLLVELGEDPDRDGLVKTPMRVAKSLAFLTRGYRQTPRGVLNGAVFDAGANHMTASRAASRSRNASPSRWPRPSRRRQAQREWALCSSAATSA